MLDHTDTSLIEEWESQLHPELLLDREKREQARRDLISWKDKGLIDETYFQWLTRQIMGSRDTWQQFVDRYGSARSSLAPRSSAPRSSAPRSSASRSSG